MFLSRVAATPERPAYMYPAGDQWTTLTWAQVGKRVRALASGLRALGLVDEQRVAIISGPRFDWVLCDLAIMCGGGATTTVYPSSTAEDCAYILKDSSTGFVFA